jgi:hypothetical protein
MISISAGKLREMITRASSRMDRRNVTLTIHRVGVLNICYPISNAHLDFTEDILRIGSHDEPHVLVWLDCGSISNIVAMNANRYRIDLEDGTTLYCERRRAK